jgi:hypothetical protein
MPAAAEPTLYVYALAEPGLPRRFSILGRRLQSVGFGGIEAVVERGAAVEPSTEAVERQHGVITRLAARGVTILPARFGSSVTEESLRTLLDRRRDEVLAGLRRVRGCEQMTVRVFGEPEQAVSASPPTSGTVFLQQRRAQAHHETAEVAVIRREFGDCVRADCVERGRHGVRVTVFHLVPRQRLATYQRRALVLQRKLRQDGVTVTITGPWPAFAFTPDLF